MVLVEGIMKACLLTEPMCPMQHNAGWESSTNDPQSCGDMQQRQRLTSPSHHTHQVSEPSPRQLHQTTSEQVASSHLTMVQLSQQHHHANVAIQRPNMMNHHANTTIQHSNVPNHHAILPIQRPNTTNHHGNQ